MKRQLVLGLVVAAFACAAQANLVEPSSSMTLEERANARAATITDAEAFLDEIDHSVSLARAGDYGKMKRGDITRMNKARDLIADLLEGHSNAMELPQEERVDLFNAQEVLTAAIRADEKDRKVCKFEPVTGSRLAKTECMTVAEREERAQRARENTEQHIRTTCVPGEFNRC